MNIKRKFHSIIQTVFILGLILVMPLTSLAAISSLDFGWGSPILIKQSGQKQMLAWPIQISNPTKKPWFAKLDVVAVTDTGKQYSTISNPDIEDIDGISPLSVLKSHIFPSVTRRTIALFEEVDPKATLIHFYVGGIVDPSQKEQGETRYFRITYQRTVEGWKWNGSNILE